MASVRLTRVAGHLRAEPCAQEDLQIRLTHAQREQLFQDGFVIVRGVVPRELTQRAKALVPNSLYSQRVLTPSAELTTHKDVLALFNDTVLSKIMHNEVGSFPPVIGSQVAIHPGGQKYHSDTVSAMGAHIDGSISTFPRLPSEITADGLPIDRESIFGENDEVIGSNAGVVWQDPDRTISVGSYTAIVGVALNNQLTPGKGQFGVLRGMHEDVEASFQMQRDAGGPVGPEGPGWPRFKKARDGSIYYNGLPESVEKKAMDPARAVHIDGWPWPFLKPVLLDEGDAVIALHSLPHTPTPNLSDDPRMNVYFRIRKLREGNHNEGTRRVGHGVNDHPDRGAFGQWLEYPPSYNPWKTSLDTICDHWREWENMRDIVNDNRSKTEGTNNA
jgi:hypothetical protein